ILSIDFADPEDINIQKVAFDLEATEYALLVVETGSSHADLTDAYAAIPEEMKAVAKSLGAEVLRQTDKTELMRLLSSVRADLGDRAVLRALHFYHENGRVDQMLESLKIDDFDGYLKSVGASAASSQNILQNVLPPMTDGKEQGVSFALGLSQLFFEEKQRGQARVHGGGFAGTIQAYVHR
ncbi:MAG: galactokinase, partial [bacterium]|nr:galactokinase [bacterium]